MRCNLAVYRLMHAETILSPSRRMNRRQCSEALPLRHGRLAPRLTPAIEEATMSRLQNKVAVITGGTSGIGLAAAQRFVAEGAFVYIFARRQDELDKTVASIGRDLAGVQGDVRRLEDLDRLYAKVASDGRRLDVVVANVGAVDSVKLADVTIERQQLRRRQRTAGRRRHVLRLSQPRRSVPARSNRPARRSPDRLAVSIL